jgi:hypothetical protein
VRILVGMVLARVSAPQIERAVPEWPGAGMPVSDGSISMKWRKTLVTNLLDAQLIRICRDLQHIVVLCVYNHPRHAFRNNGSFGTKSTQSGFWVLVAKLRTNVKAGTLIYTTNGPATVPLFKA